MKITFLGTGTSQGIPVIASDDPVCLSDDKRDKRLRCSALISWDDKNYVIDCGPDFRQQILRENVRSIDGILFTHEHADHTAGLDDIRSFSYMLGQVPIYCTERVLDNLKQRFSYIFAVKNRYRGAPRVRANIVGDDTFFLDRMKVTPVSASHGKLSVTGYRFDNIAYLTDVKTISAQEKNKLIDLDILVINALQIEPHQTHLNLSEALSLVEEIQPKKAYFTHINHRLGFHSVVEKQLPENVFLAYDGLVV